MQEEVNQKTVALIITGAKVTTSVLVRAIMRKLQADKQKVVSKQQARKQAKKYQQPIGKIKVKELVQNGGGVSNMEINDHNIKGFERTAKKYGLTFALQKVKGVEPPRHIVYFRGRDTDVINQAFKEFVGKEMGQDKGKKPSLHKKLEKFKNLVASQVKKSRNKTKDLER